MSFTLVLNSANNTNTTLNTQFKYSFLAGNFHAKDMEMCVSAVTLPYAFFNVSTYYANQNFSLNFPTGSGTYNLAIVLPAGFYTVTDIQNYIQNQCLANGLYLVNKSTSQNVFFFNIAYNTTYYTTQIVCSQVPSQATYSTTYNLPPASAANIWSTSGQQLPASLTTQVPQLILPATAGINSIIGFPTGSGTYPSTPTQASTYTQTGSGAQTAAGISPTVAPIGSTINSIVMRCSFLKNNVSVPSDILDGFPINTTFGSNITYTPTFQKWIPINDGVYSNFLFSFVDQNLNVIYSNDPNISLTLIIRKKEN
jgi:hypothetical protein